MRNLTKERIHQIVESSVRKVLKENEASIKEPYYNLVNAIDAFESAFENEYDITDENNNEVITAIETARQKLDDFVRHPEGSGDTKMWDNVGF